MQQHLPHATIVLVFISSEKAISNHPHALGNVARILRHIELENLKHVDLLRAGRKAGIAEDGTERFALCNLLDHAFGNIRVKTGDQVAVIVGMDGTAVDLLRLQSIRQPNSRSRSVRSSLILDSSAAIIP